jgi:hypothetical protein
VCSPTTCIAARFREPSANERAAIQRILHALGQADAQPTGRLYREAFRDESIDRRTFEHLLGGLERAGFVKVTEASFEKEGGERVSYQRAALTPAGRRRGGDGLASITVSRSPSTSKPVRKKRPKGGKKRFSRKRQGT